GREAPVRRCPRDAGAPGEPRHDEDGERRARDVDGALSGEPAHLRILHPGARFALSPGTGLLPYRESAMRIATTRFLTVAAGVVVALCASRAGATTIQDLARIKGHENNVLTGMGIVVGLNGTGDTSKDSLIAARPYAELLRNYGNAPLAPREVLAADSFA